MKNAYTKISTKKTPQDQPVLGETQIKNAAGGYVFKLDKWNRLNRFLILGSEGGTYYTTEQSLTVKNTGNLLACLKEDSIRVVDAIVEISTTGRAFKNEPALFALAVAASKGQNHAYALSKLPLVARIPTHLFHFVQYARQFRGWGRGMRKAVASWYTSQDRQYHLIKYQSRDGWSNADLIRLSHPKPTQEVQINLWKWVLEKEADLSGLPLVEAFEKVKKATTAKEVSKLVADHKLPRECVPTQWLNDAMVWEALMEDMPLTAMIRNLGKMTNIGLLDPFSKWTKDVVESLTFETYLKRSRIHPMTLLIALKVYSQGKGDQGSLSWNPVSKIVDALDEAFYLSFGNVEPTGKNILVAVDASGSMGHGTMNGIISCRQAAFAQALITANVEKNVVITAFGTNIKELSISPRERLDDVMKRYNSSYGGTDCSLPLELASSRKWDVDAIEIITDNETWAGGTHVFQAVESFRQKHNPNLRFVDVAMTATDSQLSKTADPLSLEVVGFDANVPQVVSQFISGL